VGQHSLHVTYLEESGEGRLIILNLKRRPTVAVEVKDLGEVNEGWRGNRLLESRPEGANLTSIRVPGNKSQWSNHKRERGIERFGTRVEQVSWWSRMVVWSGVEDG
jgi:hypothetical protein